jgi:hypothetical protein
MDSDSTYDWVELDPEWDQYDRAARRQYAHCIAAKRAEKAIQWNPEADNLAVKAHKQKLLD